MWNLFRYFTYLGWTGFGGPLVLVQLMRQHYVDSKKELSSVEFDQAFTFIKAMPGPVAFQMAVYLGQRQWGIRGGLIAGLSLLWPSFLIMILLGVFYEYMQSIKFVNAILDGFLYSVTAVILFSLKGMVTPHYKKSFFWALIVVTFICSFFHWAPEPILILIAGLSTVFVSRRKTQLLSVSYFPLLEIDWWKIWNLFKVCFYGGAFVFGTGLAVLPVLKLYMVDAHAWITLKEFNDGVIFGQMTPGPVTITGTFLGYQAAGIVGAFTATLGIFIMPFVHMTTWFPRALNWLGRQTWIQSFLFGATAAVVGAIVYTLVSMNQKSGTNVIFWLLFIGSFAILIKKVKIPVIGLIFCSGLVNLIVNLFTMNSV